MYVYIRRLPPLGQKLRGQKWCLCIRSMSACVCICAHIIMCAHMHTWLFVFMFASVNAYIHSYIYIYVYREREREIFRWRLTWNPCMTPSCTEPSSSLRYQCARCIHALSLTCRLLLVKIKALSSVGGGTCKCTCSNPAPRANSKYPHSNAVRISCRSSPANWSNKWLITVGKQRCRVRLHVSGACWAAYLSRSHTAVYYLYTVHMPFLDSDDNSPAQIHAHTCQIASLPLHRLRTAGMWRQLWSGRGIGVWVGEWISARRPPAITI
jgi:hypothetical protein